MADLDLLQEELSSGALVAPFDVVVRDDTGYFLLATAGRFQEPKIAAFRDWLLAEAAGSGASPQLKPTTACGT